MLVLKQIMNTKTFFMNGGFLPVEQRFISVRTHGLIMGTGCLEGIRGYWNEEQRQMYLFRLADHFKRLHRSCQILQMHLSYTIEELIDIAVELLQRNEAQEDVYILVTAYKNVESLDIRLHGIPESLVMSVMPMGAYRDLTGIKCGISSWRRINDNAIPIQAKVTGGYVNSALARSEVLLNGFDEAILLNDEGHVAEASAENIFLVTRGVFVTPSITENILPGITRDTIIEIGRHEMGLSTCERAVDRTELYIADEVFLCGTGAQVAPVVNIDHRNIGDGTVGPIASKVLETYLKITRGAHDHYREQWCTPVYTEKPGF